MYLLQRKTGKPGAGLGKTTGWIHRAAIRAKGVETLSGVTYRRVDDDGLHITIDDTSRVLDVEHVVICAGQVSRTDLLAGLREAGISTHLIGGAHLADRAGRQAGDRSGQPVGR